jgi:hypothetical protein
MTEFYPELQPRGGLMRMRQSIALRTIATHPRMIAAVAATVAGCLALLMAFVVGLVG